MKQITQKELIDLIKEKQENAKNMFYETRDNEKDFGKAELKKARCLAEMNAYQDLICYLNSREIVPEKKLLEPLCNKCSKTNETCPFHRIGSAYEDCSNFEEEQIVTTIPKAKREELGLTKEDLKKWLEKAPITPYNEPKVEPQRNDRFREFVDGETTLTIDAKAISSIKVNIIDLNVQINENGNYRYEKFFESEDEAKAYYNDLLAWVKYWKRN